MPEPLSASVADSIEQHRAENDQTEHDLLRVAFDVGEVHAVLDHGDGGGLTDRTMDCPLGPHPPNLESQAQGLHIITY